MKLYTNKKYNTVAFYAIVVIAVNVLLVMAIFKFNSILSILNKALDITMPIIWGLAIAFLINPLMVTTERIYVKLFKKVRRPKLMRAVSVTIASILFLGMVVGIIAVIVPEFVNNFNEIVNNFSDLIEKAQDWMNKILKNYPKVQEMITKKLNEFGSDLTKLQPMLENILNGAVGVVNVVYNFVLGFIVSIYLLISKEKHIAETKKILFANFKKSSAEKILHFGQDANMIFSGFISGKLIDSLIIGIICFIGLTLIGMPYNVLISVIVGVTNIIPFFGPFIGAVPSALLILLVEPKMVIWLLLFILLLQQFDGNILGPKILGNSTGLPAIWVMISLFICGGLFGFVGMALGVPTFALMYKIAKENINNKLKRKKMPTDTQYYIDNADKLTAPHIKKVPLTPEELDDLIIPSCDEVNEAVEGSGIAEVPASDVITGEEPSVETQ
ncbi:MAG: AI-2E family transporter [Ruminococcus sp.]|nr:AI-2E family transporter [Ruminococcus sp.]